MLPRASVQLAWERPHENRRTEHEIYAGSAERGTVLWDASLTLQPGLRVPGWAVGGC